MDAQLIQAMSGLSVAEKGRTRAKKAYGGMTEEQKEERRAKQAEQAKARRAAKKAVGAGAAEPVKPTDAEKADAKRAKERERKAKVRAAKKAAEKAAEESETDEEDRERLAELYRRSEELRKERLAADEKRKREEVPPAEVPTLGGEKPSSVKELLARLAEKGWEVKTVRVNKNPVPPGQGAKRFGKTVGGYYSGYAPNSPENIDAEHNAPLLVAPDGKTAWEVPDATFTSKRKYGFSKGHHPTTPYALWTEDRYVEIFPQGTIAGNPYSNLPGADHFTLRWSRIPGDDVFTTTLS